MIHIVPSGSDKTLCGKEAKETEHSSLGMGCNCAVCTKVANKIIKKSQD